MKLMSWMIIAVCCAFAFAPYSPADAQQRDRGYHRGGGHGGGYGDRGRRQYYRERRPGYVYHPGYGWYNPSAVIGGAVGSWLWRQWAQPEPAPVIVVPQEPVRGVEWCMNRYKSYDPYTKTYLGYDGLRHGCP